MKKCLLLTLCCCLLLLSGISQVIFSTHCTAINQTGYQIQVAGKLGKGWRIYTTGDTSLNLAPLALSWEDVSMIKSGTATITNKRVINDALFNNRSFEVVDRDFVLTQTAAINGTAPAALLIKITGFAASKDQFIPIDTA